MSKLALLFLLYSFSVFSQHKSIMQEESEYYKSLGISAEEYSKVNKPAQMNKQKNTSTCSLNKIVYGWHPYWVEGLEANYDWNLLSDLCFFSYEVNTSTGNAITTNGWATSQGVTAAINNGVNAHLCVTMFNDHATFFGSSTAQQTLIDNLISLINNRGAKGVNIDFESVPSSQKANLTNFMIDLCTQMHSQIPGSIVSIDLYSVDWGAVFDIPALQPYVDLFMIMGYDYYYSGSSEAGPNSPLYSLTSSYNYNLSKSITYYLSQGLPSSKLVMGIPYYGRDWATSGSTVPSSTTASGQTRTYKTVMDNASGYYNTRLWHANTFNSYYTYNNGSWHQCFTDDEYTLPYKYEMFNRRNLAGIAIWTLGYDDGYTALWDKIEEYFTNCTTTVCSDYVYDMGGPALNYYDKEDYTYTIAPTGASGLTLNFSEFSLEAGYDSLWIYDGNNTSSPLIGGYSGTTSPGNITANGGALTLKFHSDNATTSFGFKALWQCTIDNVLPTTTISTNNLWETQNFTSNFTDFDANGIKSRFYQVIDFNGTEWSANTNYGFFADNFTSLNANNWQSVDGTWLASNDFLEQSNETISNTIFSASLNQNNEDEYLYNFGGLISGTGTNKRAGLHFMCSSPTLANRGNSYFVYFRTDNARIEIYKVINDVLQTPITADYVLQDDVFYDYKITYSKITGEIVVYVNNQKVMSWTDANPYQTGDYISFRTGNCNLKTSEIKVYHSREASENITIGDANQEVRYQNINPSTFSSKIKSIAVDNNYLLSDINYKDINTDWTNPSDVSFVNDGLSSDIDEINVLNSVSANWDNSIDANSDIKQYWYSIGTTVGGVDLLNWTNLGNVLNFSNSTVNTTNNSTYFVNVKSENNAGLFSQVVSSDGFLVNTNTFFAVENNETDFVKVFPSPVTNSLNIKVYNSKKHHTVKIFSANGEIVLSENYEKSEFNLDVSNFTEGLYFIVIDDVKSKFVK